MARAYDIWRRYRIPAFALVISATLHAAVMVGIPGPSGLVEDDAGPAYLATLDLSAPPAAAVEAAPKPAPKPRRPASRRVKPHAAPIVVMASDALESALPEENYAPESPSSEELAPPPTPAPTPP